MSFSESMRGLSESNQADEISLFKDATGPIHDLNGQTSHRLALSVIVGESSWAQRRLFIVPCLQPL